MVLVIDLSVAKMHLLIFTCIATVWGGMRSSRGYRGTGFCRFANEMYYISILPIDSFNNLDDSTGLALLQRSKLMKSSGPERLHRNLENHGAVQIMRGQKWSQATLIWSLLYKLLP